MLEVEMARCPVLAMYGDLLRSVSMKQKIRSKKNDKIWSIVLALIYEMC